MILEEALETIHDGLGVDVLVDGRDLHEMGFDERRGCMELVIARDFDLIETIDGCCDVKVVTTGTLSACGVDDEDVQWEVDRNNMQKFGPGHSLREDGKLIKPPDHKPPDIAGILKGL